MDEHVLDHCEGHVPYLFWTQKALNDLRLEDAGRYTGPRSSSSVVDLSFKGDATANCLIKVRIK